ncbi:hypothetical protein DLAC_00219 [Tieghemostelium lacteum]|uniref:Uncharacterized protein n=1 Tax=Tieghemostelium lacteum TaxID=361077 RepID=A0A152A960_TIELA|nr:hypothetical protein DLAC_00219 [Tieghemostelium lacteum]|eukprot:KYR02756.1 hypothetical protein DLAC_00219 [Tieghemostelium lacteum]
MSSSGLVNPNISPNSLGSNNSIGNQHLQQQLPSQSIVSNSSGSNNNNNNNNSGNDKILLLCSTCHLKINQDVKELTEKVLPGFHDSKYSFTCKSCSASKTPILYHLGKSWKCVIHTALFNMERQNGCKYFHHSDVTTYVSKYPNVFLHDKSLADISKAVSMAFFNNKGYFISGGPYTGKWANPSPDRTDLESTMDTFDSPLGENGNTGHHEDRHLLSPSRSRSRSLSRSRSRSRSMSNSRSRSRSMSGSRSISRGRSHSRSRSGSRSSISRSRSRSNSFDRQHHSHNNGGNSNNHQNTHHQHQSINNGKRVENLSSSSRGSNNNSDYDSESESDNEYSKKYLTCGQCKNLFSAETIPTGKVIPGPFDKCYEYTCKFCCQPESDQPLIKHQPKTWTKILHTALHNLELDRRIRFHSTKDIYQYILTNIKDLQSEPKQDVSIDIINYVLESGRRLFINSTKDNRLWCNRKKNDKVTFDNRNILVLTKELSQSGHHTSSNNGHGPSSGSGGQKKRSHDMMDDDHHHSSSSGSNNNQHKTLQQQSKSKSSQSTSGTSTSTPSINITNSNGKNLSGNVALQNIRLTPLYCNQCKNWFPNAASDLMEDNPTLIIPSHIDKRYIYTCSKCSDKKSAILIHLPKSWKIIVHTTLYNLGILSGQKFSSNKTLYSFISDNANTLLLGGKTIDYLNKNLSGVLSSYKNLFCSSGRNMWGNVSQYSDDDKIKMPIPSGGASYLSLQSHHQSNSHNNNNNNNQNNNNSSSNNGISSHSINLVDDDDKSDDDYQPKKKFKSSDNTSGVGDLMEVGDSSPNIKLKDASKLKIIQQQLSSNQQLTNSNKPSIKPNNNNNNGNNNNNTSGSSSAMNQSPQQNSKSLVLVSSTSNTSSNANSNGSLNVKNSNGNINSFTIDEDLMDDDIEIQIHDERIQSLLGFLKLNLNNDLKSLRKEIDVMEIPELRGLEFRFLLRKSPISLKQENSYLIKDCLYSSDNSMITIGIRSILPILAQSPPSSLASHQSIMSSPTILSSSSPLALSSIPDASAFTNHPYFIFFSQFLNNLKSIQNPTSSTSSSSSNVNNQGNNNNNNSNITVSKDDMMLKSTNNSEELLPLPIPNTSH